MPGYRDSHKMPGKGEAYEKIFRENPWLLHLWRREKKYVEYIVESSGARGDYLDFACGTGRLLSAIGKKFKNSTGVDVSEEMTAFARKNAPGAEVILADLTMGNILEGRTFDVITAFRFFPNAEPELREKAMLVLAKLLRPQGALIFNNHQNASSTLVRIAKTIRKTMVWTPMTGKEVLELVSRSGLVIEQAYALGVLPATPRRKIVPSFIHDALDGLARLAGVDKKMGQDVIYVCRKG